MVARFLKRRVDCVMQNLDQFALETWIEQREDVAEQAQFHLQKLKESIEHLNNLNVLIEAAQHRVDNS